MTDSLSSLQVVVLAAGKGVRMRSHLPKVLHRVCGRSLLNRTLVATLGAKPARAIVVIGYGEQLLREELERLSRREELSKIPLVPVVQSEQLGTGHAVQMAVRELSESEPTVLILPGDCPLIEAKDLQQLIEAHRASGAALSVLTAEVDKPQGFGRILRDKSGAVRAIVEEKDASAEERKIREINSSIYCCDRALLVEALAALRNDNAQREYYLTDIVPYAVSKGAKVQAVIVGRSEAVLGANNRAELSALETLRRSALNTKWMEHGVTLEDPATTYIDEDVVLSEDVFIGAGSKLRGKTRVERGVVIDGGSLIVDSFLGEGTHVKLSCVIDSSVVGARCDIGPFAHLRPGSKLHESVKVGNFVETKKSELHRGAKANHLTYLGDAEVGAEANIGAGTITCNYDGVNKHKTEIGERVFVGSNSCLVAPVKIGADAYIGAGSTITKEIPAGALGIGRARQENVEGWVERKKRLKEKR